MAINSNQKGKRGERMLCKALNKHGYECRRSQQFSGANGDADIVGLHGIYPECKFVEKLNIHNAMKQAEGDAINNRMPTVFHKKNGTGWLVTCSLESWVKLHKVREWKENMGGIE